MPYQDSNRRQKVGASCRAALPPRRLLHRTLFLSACLGFSVGANAIPRDGDLNVAGEVSPQWLPLDQHYNTTTPLTVSGDVNIAGAGVIATEVNTAEVQIVHGGNAGLTAAKNVSVGGSMSVAGGLAVAISDGRDPSVPDNGPARAAGGHAYVQIGSDLNVAQDLAVRVQDTGATLNGTESYAKALAGSAHLTIAQNLSVGHDLLIEAGEIYTYRSSSSAGNIDALREAAQVTVGVDAIVGGNLSMSAQAVSTANDDYLGLFTSQWKAVELNVGRDLRVQGNTLLTGSDTTAGGSSIIEGVGVPQAGGDAGSISVSVARDSYINGSLTLQGGSATAMWWVDNTLPATANAQSVQYIVGQNMVVQEGITLRGGDATARFYSDQKIAIANGGNSRLQVAGDLISAGPIQVVAGSHDFSPVAGDPSGLGARGGSATLAVGGTLAVYHPDGITVAGEQGAVSQTLENNTSNMGYGQARLSVGTLRTPMLVLNEVNQATIGTLDMRATSTQLQLSNTLPFDPNTQQGVRLGNLLFGGGNALNISGNGGFAFQGDITVLGPNASYQGPVLTAQGAQLNFLLPATANNGTTMLHTTTPVATDGATVSMQAAGPLKQLNVGDRIHLIDATTGTVANAGAYNVQYGAYQYQFDVQSAADLSATLTGTNLTLAADQLYPRSIAASMAALSASGNMISAADLRGPQRRGFFLSPEVGRMYINHSGLTLDRSNVLFGYALGGTTATGDYIIAPLIEAGRSNYRARASSGGLSADGKGTVDNVGAGLLARYWFQNGLYAEASLRGGRMRGNYADNIDGSTDYKSRSTYWGTHGTLGYVHKLNDQAKLDSYVRVQWQRLDGDSVHNAANDALSYSALQSLRTRIGTRYIQEVGAAAQVYAGLAWEYDAKTQVRARLDGAPLSSTDLNGAAGIVEAGMRWEPSALWTVRLSGTGQFGTRQGIAGEAFIYRRF